MQITINQVSTIDDINVHSRWDENHLTICEDCYADNLDTVMDMNEDAKLDAMGELECQ